MDNSSPVLFLCWVDLSQDNFLVQCHGTKRVCLFPPDCAKHLYVNSKYDSGTLCCDVNVFEPETWILFWTYRIWVKDESCLEDYPRTGEWLITMVSFRPLTGDYSLSKWPKWPKWFINGGDPNYLLNGMILQVGKSKKQFAHFIIMGRVVPLSNKGLVRDPLLNIQYSYCMVTITGKGVNPNYGKPQMNNFFVWFGWFGNISHLKRGLRWC